MLESSPSIQPYPDGSTGSAAKSPVPVPFLARFFLLRELTAPENLLNRRQ